MTPTATEVAKWHKPVRRGAIYCAPFCGYRCTWAAFQKATRDAQALCKRLGKGWQPRVWENLGWHYSAIDASSYWKVNASKYRGEVIGYLAFFGVPEPSGGRWAEHGKTPEEAIANMQRRVRGEVRELAKLNVLLENVVVRRPFRARAHSPKR